MLSFRRSTETVHEFQAPTSPIGPIPHDLTAPHFSGGNTITQPAEPTGGPGEMPTRRRFIKGILAVVSTTAISVDWPGTIETIAQYFREPSTKADPKSVPNDQPIYRTSKPETPDTVVAETMYGSRAEYLLAADKINRCESLTELDEVAQNELFNKIGGRVAFGKSNQPEKWKVFASSEAQRLTGLPVERLGGLEATFGLPTLEQAQYAVLRTQAFAAMVPLQIHRTVNLTECGFVAGMGVTSNLLPEQKIDNGVSDTVHRAVMVDCVEGKKRRTGVGVQWLRQDCMVLDAVISNSPTAFNDPEFALLIPELANVTQRRLDYPDRHDTEVFSIASTKAERYTEILSGRLILPADPAFGSIEQTQQELLLRRLYGTFPDIPPSYFEDLALYRRTHDDALPTCGQEVVT